MLVCGTCGTRETTIRWQRTTEKNVHKTRKGRGQITWQLESTSFIAKELYYTFLMGNFDQHLGGNSYCCYCAKFINRLPIWFQCFVYLLVKMFLFHCFFKQFFGVAQWHF